MILSAILAAVVLADYALTRKNLSQGGREGNTLLASHGAQIFVTLACLWVAYASYIYAFPWFLIVAMTAWKGYGAYTNVRAIKRRAAR